MQESLRSGGRRGRRLGIAGGGGLAVVALLAIATVTAWPERAQSSGNLLVNGSFEDVSGLKETEFGFTGQLPGWTSAEPHVPELVRDGTVGMPAADGAYWVDTGEKAANVIDLSQKVEGLSPGAMLRLVFQAGQWRKPSAEPDETLNVYWGGERIAVVRPETVGGYELFEFEVVAGAGDGTDTLRFEGVSDGSSDGQGVVLDGVGLFETSATPTGTETGSASGG